MTFSVTNNATTQELSEAVNYLLANFSQTMAINPNTGSITTASYGVVSYLYKYLQVRYADSYDGTVNFSNVSTNRLYYGIRNNDSAIESTDPKNYQWLPVTGGFGTTKFFWYNTTGGRQIETFIGPARPRPGFVQDNGNAIDLDLLTTAVEDKTDPVAVDNSSQLQALEQAIGMIPQPQLGTLSPQNAENVAITGGNISNVNLSQATVVDYENFSSVAAPSYAVGRTWYDSSQNTLAYYNDVTNNLVHIGQETQVKVINNTGSSIAIGSPVYITSTSSGFSYPNVALAKADALATSAVLGLTTQAIANGASGYVTTSGIIQPCNTGTFTVGTVVYLSPYSAGQLMGTIPPTGYPIQVGVVAYSNSPNGAIYVKQTTPLAVAASSLTGLVSIANGGTGTATPGLVQGTNITITGSWPNQTINSSGGGGSGTVTSVAALTLGTSGTDLSSTVANSTTTPVITLNVPTASAANRGVLSSADWTTFNNKGSGTVTSVTGTAPVVSSGGTTPAISMAAATTSVSGYLTSTDWNTFNNKQAAGSYITPSSTDTLTNKRVTPRVGTTTSSATPTINTDNVDVYGLTAQAVDITSFTTNLSGTPTNGQLLRIYIVGTAARAIAWGSSFEASTTALPTTTVLTNRLDVGFVWNAATSKWRCLAYA